jgi:hypothetical protein
VTIWPCAWDHKLGPEEPERANPALDHMVGCMGLDAQRKRVVCPIFFLCGLFYKVLGFCMIISFFVMDFGHFLEIGSPF